MSDRTDSEQQARAAREALVEKKGQDPLILDVRGISTVTDFFVIATGNSTPHLKAMQTEVNRHLASTGAPRHGRTGTADTGWLVLDYLDVIVHLFTPEKRAYYALEDLWSDAPRLG